MENVFYRYKTIIGKKLRARTEKRREVEAVLGCIVLNRFTELGRCGSELVVSTEDSGVQCVSHFICAIVPYFVSSMIIHIIGVAFGFEIRIVGCWNP